MNKKIIMLLGIIAALAGGAGVYSYINAKNAFTPQECVEVQRGQVYTSVSGEGKIGVKNTVYLYIENSQTIEHVHVKEGDSVKAGDILITYDIASLRNDLERQLKEAQLNLQNARLNLNAIQTPASGNELVQYENDILSSQKNIDDTESELESIGNKIEQQQIKLNDAKTTMERNEELLGAGAITQRAYDDSATVYELYVSAMKDLETQKVQKERTLETRNTQLELSEQKLKNAKNRLLDEATAIKYEIQQNTIALYGLTIDKLNDDLSKLTEESVAQISGTVTKVNVQDGGTASKNMSLITISDTSDIVAKMDLSEFDAPGIESYMKVYITTSGIADMVYTGTISKIAAEAVEKTSSSDNEIIVPVEIEIENLDSRLKIGYSVDVEIFTAERENVLRLPATCVYERDGKKYCYVMSNESYIETEVSTGLYGDKFIEITGGLEEGRQVVLSPWKNM